MSLSTPAAPPAPAQQPGTQPLNLEQALLRSRAFAGAVAYGLPTAGVLILAASGVPLFAALMAGCLLLATALTCYKAVATFAGKTLRLLVTARLVFVLVLGALLLVASGDAWVGL